MTNVRVVKPEPGQSIEEALRTAPVHQVSQAMFARCPKAIIDFAEPGSPGAHYDAQGVCQCARDKANREAMKRADKVGWGSGGNFFHLVVQPEDRKMPERPVCGVKVAITGREPRPAGPACVKCRAYAAKRRWL